MIYIVGIRDLAEGTMKHTLRADSDDAALEEAAIYAAEQGCTNVEEIVILETFS